MWPQKTVHNWVTGEQDSIIISQSLNSIGDDALKWCLIRLNSNCLLLLDL